MSRRIPVTDPDHPNAPYFAIVDDSNYEWLNQFKWCRTTNSGLYRHTIYAVRSVALPGESKLMHKMITNYKRTDHANGIGLDNRRENLRETTQSQNQANSHATLSYGGKPTSSKYKGVKKDSTTGRWMVQVFKEGKQYWVGRFVNEEEAARAYDTKAKELFGEFARLNFPT